MNTDPTQRMFINKNIDKFIINENKNLREAINKFGDNFGFPLIVINNNSEFVGTLSNGDIRIFLSRSEKNIGDLIKKAVNKNSKYCFEDSDKSIYDHFLSEKNIRIIPILNQYKKLKAVAYYEKIFINIGSKTIKSDTNDIYLIAELGVNHNGNYQEAIKLIDNIYDAGFDAVKMQFRSQETYSNDRFENNLDLGTEYILSELDRVHLTVKEEKKIIEYIKKKNLDFIGTPFDKKSLKRLISNKPVALKIASCDLTNIFLLEACAGYNLPLILSTGMSTETEIIKTNEFLEGLNVNRCFLHCNSTYPTPLEDVQLNYINRLKKITNCIVGYSSHDGDKLIAVSSISAGAKIIEVHVTEDKNAIGTDHLASITINETSEFVKSARKICIANGFSNPRIPSQGELLNKISLGKSLCYANEFKKGYRINSSEDFLGCSPGDGIKIYDSGKLNNKVLNRNVKKLDKVSNHDFIGNYEDLKKFSLTNISKKVLNEFKWGIPVRYRDIERLNSIFNPPLLEIHLSSKDLGFNINTISRVDLMNKQLVVHAIEQYHDGFIMDLGTTNKDLKSLSLKRFNEFILHCQKLLDHFGSKDKLKIVLNCGGFTKKSFCDKKTYKEKKKILYDNLNYINQKYSDFTILPQTMPPFPWHQGGSSFHNLLRSSRDIVELNQETGLFVCFDFSHTYMESNYSKLEFNEIFLEIIKYSDHLHLSDSSSSSNEGLNIDDGNIDFDFCLSKIFKIHKKNKITFIPEVWQGHMNNGEGFRLSLERIARHLA